MKNALDKFLFRKGNAWRHTDVKKIWIFSDNYSQSNCLFHSIEIGIGPELVHVIDRDLDLWPWPWPSTSTCDLDLDLVLNLILTLSLFNAMLKKDLMNETYCVWCFFFNKSRNKRAGALLHNPCGFVTDIYIHKYINPAKDFIT